MKPGRKYQMIRGRKVYDYEPREGDDILEDGDVLHVPLMMCDAAQRDLQEHFDTQTVVDHKLAAHNRYSANRPGFVQDQLRQGAGQTMQDCSDDLHRRTGTCLKDAVRARDAAFAQLESRSLNAWRDAPDDNQNTNLSAQAEAPYRYWAPRDLFLLASKLAPLLGLSKPIEHSQAPLEFGPDEDDEGNADLRENPVPLASLTARSGTAGLQEAGDGAALRDAAFAALEKRSQNAWRGGQ